LTNWATTSTPAVIPSGIATHLPENNYDIRTVQEPLGHNDVRTTQFYTHVTRNRLSVKSPVDEPARMRVILLRE
jgi:site-specific recombinase XerD